MKAFRRIVTTSMLLIIAGTTMAYFFWYQPKFYRNNNYLLNRGGPRMNSVESNKLKRVSATLKKFAVGKYNSHYCFMVDMSLPSGKKRFFVYNLENDSVELAGLVTHGSGCEKGPGKFHFSNQPGSNCSSVGKYKIGGSYYGKFGLAFKLHGLDLSNNNAYARSVVLHALPCVPDEEVAPFSICKSFGCCSVSPTFLIKLTAYLERSGKPVLLDIIE